MKRIIVMFLAFLSLVAGRAGGGEVLFDGTVAHDDDGYVKYYRWYQLHVELVGLIVRDGPEDDASYLHYDSENTHIETLDKPQFVADLPYGKYVFGLEVEDDDGVKTRLWPYDPADVTNEDGWYVVNVFDCKKELAADINKDCYVNLKDLQIMASEWLECGNPFDTNCKIY